MAQLVLIKDANTDAKEVDDIIGAFESNHKFTDYEKLVFNFQQVEGYTREELAEFMFNKQIKHHSIYKYTTANEWTLNPPEYKKAWQHTDDKWYFLEKQPKYQLTIKNMTIQEKDILASKSSTTLDKLNALAHIESKESMQPENMIAIAELNK